ncbi:arginine N-methyltransferase-like protein [Usnea florida]
MEAEVIPEIDSDIKAQSILLAASQHNLASLRSLLRAGSANVQDPETGFTPLHAAIAACEPSQNVSDNSEITNGHVNGTVNGDANGDHSSTAESDVEAAAKTMKLLLQNGAIWNDVDKTNETPGCLALRLGLRVLYEIMVDAGVRAEMLLNRLDEYEQLAGGDDDEDEGQGSDGDADKDVEVDGQSDGLQQGLDDSTENSSAINNEDYLQSTLCFQDGRILDSAGNGVMMAWETDIMQRSADLLVTRPGLRVLNIGHGMGIIDTFFQDKHPSAHHIIEAHTGVQERMRTDGWYNKQNMTIHEGRWQDVVPKIIEQGILFDAIYFDTFAEDYKALRDFFSDCIIGLLDDGGKFGFFNGLGADRQICYDVYAKVLEMDLFEAGFDTVWQTLKVPEMEKEEWDGVKRRYWSLNEYKLPTCEFIG